MRKHKKERNVPGTMAENTGITLNRTSYNTKTEVRAYVLGVLKRNTDIRNTILNKNIGKYAMYTDTLSPAIGEVYEMREGLRPTTMGVGGLLDFNLYGEFGNYLDEHYKRPQDLDVYDVINPNPVMMARWGGRYDDYIRYVSDVYGNQFWGYDILNKILTGSELGFAMAENRVGVVRDINPYLSINGAVMTNINNRSGTDTPLGLISNRLYARTLLNAAHFNSLRQGFDTSRGLISETLGIGSDVIREKRHITPELFEDIGLNLNTVNRLSELFIIKEGDIDENGNPSYLNVGRVGYIPGQNHVFLGSHYDYNSGGETPNGLAYLGDRNLEAYTQNINNKIRVTYGNNMEKYGFTKFAYNISNPYVKITEDGKIINSFVNDPTNNISQLATFNDSTASKHVYMSYKEVDGSGVNANAVNMGDGNSNRYEGTDFSYNSNGLLGKTAKLFERGKIGSLIGRFHSNQNDGSTDFSLTQTAINPVEGISRGRNLLKSGGYTFENGYDNPYCRVWTYHHQYDKMNKLIRPFISQDENSENFMKIEELQRNWNYYSRHAKGSQRLQEYTVLNENGFVNISPSVDKPDVKKTMFSIENLAWKDITRNQKNIGDNGGSPLDRKLSKEQTGPLGGRIMWFPPYDISFSENVNVQWDSKQFIGRGEKVYTYTDTDRGGMLNFTILVDHPSILNYWKRGKDTFVKDKTGSVLEGSQVSAEDDNYENDILRFFAGCGILEVDGKDRSIIETTRQPNLDSSSPVTPMEVPPEENKIVFYVYFPNNYSGFYDFPLNNKSDVNGMVYLLGGIGTQKIMSGNTLVDVPLQLPSRGGFSALFNGYERTTQGISNPSISGYSPIINEIGDEWYYRVDDNLVKEHLNHKINFKDLHSFGLNDTISSSTPKDATHSFFDVMSALSGEGSGELTKLFKNKNIEFFKIKIAGNASSHGNNDNKISVKNTNLSRRRAQSVQRWMEQFANFKIHETDGNVYDFADSVQVEKLPNYVDDIKAKLMRSVRVEINYRDRKSITPVSETNPYVQWSQLGDDPPVVTPPSSTVIENLEPQQTMTLDEFVRSIEGTTIIETQRENHRYDEEYEFFKLMDENSPIMRSRIMDKIQYFDPAFHSITPEGFTNRLGFLHQCTRQGHTLSTSDGSFAATAGNMAFGRPPVCVLRIGDFYNTKIIIDSLSISYDPMVWDLNPEGIGVQPMMAKISLNFKFLGGSDLGGPIARLQNAISDNYYANQSVFDNRADTVEYNSLGEPHYTQWKPEETI
jgi:hypothetical protein